MTVRNSAILFPENGTGAAGGSGERERRRLLRPTVTEDAHEGSEMRTVGVRGGCASGKSPGSDDLRSAVVATLLQLRSSSSSASWSVFLHRRCTRVSTESGAWCDSVAVSVRGFSLPGV